ncbi:MAG: peptidoglycan DD-metalloendopeptidase family protein [Oscillospiraceae bacterium]|nr:peptidoglycan DD-metalloendopeptidase family protein [Oscillospiraceae bacterium]
MNKNVKRVVAMTIAIILALAILASLVLPFILDASATETSTSQPRGTTSRIEELRGRQEQLANDRRQVENEISSLRGQHATAVQEMNAIERRINIIGDEIDTLQDLIGEFTLEIEQRQKELEAAQLREVEYYQLFLERLRAMDNMGRASHLGVLLQANSLSEMLTRAHDMRALMSFDQRVMDDLAVATAEVEENKRYLEDVQRELEENVAEKQIRQGELEEAHERQEVLVAEIAANQAEAEAEHRRLIAEEEALEGELQRRIQELIRREEEERRRVEAERRRLEEEARLAREAAAAANRTPPPPPTLPPPPFVATGDFRWPLPAQFTRVTSPFGWRIHPVFGGRRWHTGVDIAQAGISGQPVFAMLDGVVAESRNRGAWGNYVLINHGGGRFTKYAHLARRDVAVGARVTQGQTIGTVGSTGASTGPHLHFETWINGSPVDPMQFFSR